VNTTRLHWLLQSKTFWVQQQDLSCSGIIGNIDQIPWIHIAIE
jgi:hypothetical protein